LVDTIQGRSPQTWLDPQDTLDNMKWIEAIYAKVLIVERHSDWWADLLQNGFGSRPPSKYVYNEEKRASNLLK
jgi:hypothetical protein